MTSNTHVNTSASLTSMPKPKMVMRSLRVPEPLWERAKAKADDENTSISDVVRDLLADWVDEE